MLAPGGGEHELRVLHAREEERHEGLGVLPERLPAALRHHAHRVERRDCHRDHLVRAHLHAAHHRCGERVNACSRSPCRGGCPVIWPDYLCACLSPSALGEAPHLFELVDDRRVVLRNQLWWRAARGHDHVERLDLLVPLLRLYLLLVTNCGKRAKPEEQGRANKKAQHEGHAQGNTHN